ncbi:MAG: hypothetical protein ACK5G9_02580 [Akkermansiaceae bacterium]
MTNLQHPASLNVFNQYRQACAILKNTSRARDASWYKDALDLDFQFHIIVDGTSVLTYFYNRPNNSWSNGIHVSEEIILDPERTLALGRSLIEHTKGIKGSHLGVVIHVADEFATAEIKSKLNNPGALNDLRQLVSVDPREVLEDSSSSPDQAAWRVMPYPAAGSPMIATTIRISRRLESFLTTLRNLGNDENFPIITHALSAPLVAVMSLPLVVNTTNKPFVAVLQYPWFTAMAFFNEHADLRLIRSLQHRGQRCPSNFWSSLATTIAALEFEDPDIYLLPLGDQVDTKISEDLKRHLPHSLIQVVHFTEVSPLPVWAPEPQLSLANVQSQIGEARSHTFSVLRAERWFLQDFLPISAEESALFPSQSEIRLLRYFKIAQKIGFAAVVLSICLILFIIYTYVSKPEWFFSLDQASIIKRKMSMLGAERARIEHWNVLLDDRAKAWSTMEMIARLFPEKSGVLINGFSHSVRTEPTPKQVKVGFFKEWKITGAARSDSLDYLNMLDTREGIMAKFSELSKVIGDPSLDPTPTSRNIATTLKVQENLKFVSRPIEYVQDSDPTSYSFTFELTIVLRYDATDKLAVPVTKAP